jgi:hypothetical protein
MEDVLMDYKNLFNKYMNRAKHNEKIEKFEEIEKRSHLKSKDVDYEITKKIIVVYNKD